MDVNSLPKTVTRQRRDCHVNPGPSVPESSMLTTRLCCCLIFKFIDIIDTRRYMHRERKCADTIGTVLVP